MATRFDLYYGPSGEGKSSAALWMAQQVLRETKKKTVVYVGDGSALTYMDSGMVDDGVLELIEFSNIKNPITVCDQLAQGFKLNDKGQLVRRSPQEMAEIGCWIFEGAAVMSNYILGDVEGGMAYRAAKGEKIGEDPPIKITDEGGITVAINAPAHFNAAQRRMSAYTEKSKGLPGVVLWTTHERLDDGTRGYKQNTWNTGEKLIGPEVAGKNMTATISRIYHNTLHFVTVANTVKVEDPLTKKQVSAFKTEYRLYTRDHFDAEGNSFVKYKAVNRCLKPELMPDYLVGAKPGDNIKEFYSILAKAKEEYRKEVA